MYNKKTIFCGVVLSFALLFYCSLTVKAKTPEIFVSARSAVLLCVNNNEYVYEKDSVKQLPMASTTKVLTSLLAIEAANAENKTVKITKDMYAEGSSMYLKEGYKVKLMDLAVGMLTVSGNDAANAAAITLGGSYENFAKIMNQKAKQIGLKNSNFVTPSGLHDAEHYTTAQDLAHLFAYAMENEDFAKMSKQKSMKVNFVEPTNYSITYYNHNKLLSRYNYATGGKTGFTTEAGRCLVSSAEKEGVKLVAVTLNASNDWEDHIKMFEYGFENLTTVNLDQQFSMEIPIVGAKQANAKLITYKKATAVVNKKDKEYIKREVAVSHFIYAPVEKGQVIGKVSYILKGKTLFSNDLITEKEYCYNKINKSILENISEFFSNIFYQQRIR